MKRCLLLLLCVCAVFAGCGATDLEDQLIVDALAIDRAEEGYLLTLRLPQTDGSFQYVAGSGDTLSHAYHQATLGLTKTPLWESLNILLLAEAVAADGIDEVLRFSYSDNENRGDEAVFICEGRADAFLSGIDPPGRQLSGILRLLHECPYAARANVQDVVFAGTLPSDAPLVPYVYLDGGFTTAALHQNRLARILPEAEAAGALRVRGATLGGVLAVPMGQHYAGISLTQSETKIEFAQTADGRIARLTAYVGISPVDITDFEPSPVEILETLLASSAALIERQIRDAFDRSRDMGVDLLGLTDVYWAQTGRTAADTAAFLADTRLEIEVVVKILHGRSDMEGLYQ